MEKDKMIEELAKEIEKAKQNIWAGVRTRAEDEDYLWHSRAIAEHLIQSYRKIPDGAVVLDRHEHQKYCAYKIIEPQIKGCLDRERELEKQVAELEEQRDRQAYIAEDLIQEKHRWTEQARKETAKEILKEVAKTSGDYQWFKNLCKQFGVEVEE